MEGPSVLGPSICCNIFGEPLPNLRDVASSPATLRPLFSLWHEPLGRLSRADDILGTRNVLVPEIISVGGRPFSVARWQLSMGSPWPPSLQEQKRSHGSYQVCDYSFLASNAARNSSFNAMGGKTDAFRHLAVNRGARVAILPRQNSRLAANLFV